MREGIARIGVVAPASRLEQDIPAMVAALVRRIRPGNPPEIVFHPQCFLSSGHFAGDDGTRARAFLDVANDPAFDALWFGRGGYGSCRLLEHVLPGLSPDAAAKTYLGYSDAGSLLGALYRRGVARVAHGPMPADIRRTGGEAAVARALAFLMDGEESALEPAVLEDRPVAAFNLTILGHLIGTPFEPDLSGHVLMLEEVSEYMYRIDRALFHLTSAPSVRRVAGIRLGRVSDVPPNDPDFGRAEEEVMRSWCDRSGIPYLGRADIGHDADNKVVPFGRWRDWR